MEITAGKSIRHGAPSRIILFAEGRPYRTPGPTNSAALLQIRRSRPRAIGEVGAGADLLEIGSRRSRTAVGNLKVILPFDAIAVRPNVRQKLEGNTIRR